MPTRLMSVSRPGTAEPGTVIRLSFEEWTASQSLPAGVLANGGRIQPAVAVKLAAPCPDRTVPWPIQHLLPITACLCAMLAIAFPVRACELPMDAVAVQSRRLDLDGATYTVATQQLADINDARSRLLVLDGRCRPLWSETVDGDLSHFDVREIGGTRLLQFVTMKVAGDGTGYVHRLLALHTGRMRPALPPIEHTGKDGFYLGPLHAGRNEGVVTWTADRAGESEADAHPFVVRTWVWSGGRFVEPRQYETRRKFASPDGAPSRADFVAKAIGLSVRDQTGDVRSRFSDYERIQSRVQAAVEQ